MEIICKQQVDISSSECVNDHDDRASREPNFHMLCIDFIEKINSKHLNKELVEAIIKIAMYFLLDYSLVHLDATCSSKSPLKKVLCNAAMQQVLLKSPLIKSSDKERKLLKKLGGWIGRRSQLVKIKSKGLNILIQNL